MESHPLAHQLRRWVVATEEGEVVGHLAALPQFYRKSHQRVVAHTPADYMVLPKYGFHVITLMRKFFRTCENCVACDAAAAIRIETSLGAEEAEKLQYAAKLQNVAGLPAFPTSITAPITRLFNWGLQALDRALTATILVDHLRVEVLEGFDETGNIYLMQGRFRPNVPQPAKRLAQEKDHVGQRKIAELDERIRAEVETSGTTLTRIFGVGPILAAKIVFDRGRCRSAVGKKVDGKKALEVHNDRPKAPSAAHGEVIDADHLRGWVVTERSVSNVAQQGLRRSRHARTPYEPRSSFCA